MAAGEAAQRTRGPVLTAPVCAALAGLAAFAVYLRTLAPSIMLGDGPELTTAAYYAGVPHPSGYPLYMLLGYAFTHWLPLGSVAYRMNLLSAVAAAAAVALVSLLAARITRSAPAGAAAALLFAFSRSFWSQAISAEVYGLHLLFVAGVLGAVVAWDARGDRRWLLGAALLLGLSFTHHLSTVLLAPALLYFALTSQRRAQCFQELRWTVPLFIAPALLYAYVPLAAWKNSPANWGDPSTPANFLVHVTGRQYRDRMFHSDLPEIWRHLLDYAATTAGGKPGYLLSQFPPLLLAVAVPGLVALFRGRRRLFGLTLLLYVAVVFWAVNYSITDVEVYYLPAHLVVALWIASGGRWAAISLTAALRRLGEGRRAWVVLRTAPALLAVGLAAAGLTANWHASDRHDDWSTLTYARAALDALKPDALLVADGDSWYFPVLYTRFVEDRRPDVTAASFYDLLLPARVRRTEPLARQGVTVRIPESYGHTQDGRNWDTGLLRQLLADNVGRRPIYLLGEPVRLLSAPWLREVFADYHGTVASNVPAVELTRTAPALDRCAPQPFPRPVAFGMRAADGTVRPAVELLGFEAQPLNRAEVPWLRLRYYWQVRDPALARRVEVRAMFADAEGNYEQNEDGSVDFNNYHALGQGAAPGERDVRGRFRETFDIYVPPRAWNRPLYLWVALVADDRFLSPAGEPSRYARIGEMPRVTADASLLRNPRPGLRRASR